MKKKILLYIHGTNTNGDLIVNIKYQNKDVLICVYDNHIETIKDGVSSNISDFSQEETLFADLNNKIVKIIEKKNNMITVKFKNSTKTLDYKICLRKKIIRII